MSTPNRPPISTQITRSAHRWAGPVAALGAGALLAALLTASPPARAGAPTRCPWTASVVASGLGSLENLAFDGSGGMLLSRTDDRAGQIYRMTPDGQGASVVPNIAAPGSITVAGPTAYFTTGNSFASGILGRSDGTIDQVELATGALQTVASGLTMPNGMARLPDGSFVVSRNLGWTTGLSKVSADGKTLTPFAPALTLTNGVAYDSSRNSVITSLDLHPVATVAIIDLANPDHIQKLNLGLFGLLGFPDDLTVGADDQIYLAMDGGSVVRLDPDHHTACILSAALPGSTSVRFGAGPGWDPVSLYVTNLGGAVHKLAPTG